VRDVAALNLGGAGTMRDDFRRSGEGWQECQHRSNQQETPHQLHSNLLAISYLNLNADNGTSISTVKAPDAARALEGSSLTTNWSDPPLFATTAAACGSARDPDLPIR